MFRKKIYKWHRMLSLLAAVPMIMWSASGMLHQAGQWWKPKTIMDIVKVDRIDSSALEISLDSALRQNCYAKVQGSRIVQYRDQYFYQVRIKKNEPCVYISATNGGLLINGDEEYAVSLAFKMLDNPNAHITHRQFITEFDEHYRSSAKVLPVFGLGVKDGDSTHLYIDTYAGKLTAADNKQRHAFHTWFGYLHSWKFLDRWRYAKGIALVSYSLIALLAAILGIYLYMILPAISREKREKNVMNRRKNYHRWIGVFASFSMILFAFSGALHALVDFFPVDKTNAEPWHKTLFNHLHMFRFTQSVSKDFRFWLLMIFAFINFVTVATGLIMVTRFVVKRRKKAVPVFGQQFPAGKLA